MAEDRDKKEPPAQPGASEGQGNTETSESSDGSTPAATAAPGAPVVPQQPLSAAAPATPVVPQQSPSVAAPATPVVPQQPPSAAEAQPAAQPEPTTLEEAKTQIKSLQQRLANVASDRGFSWTGVVYIVLGLGLLLYAKHGLETSHSSFSFVLVVLGVAITLYGTGTQSAGDLKSDQTSAAKYNVYVAGGAGVLAFAVAMGMVYKHEDMKKAFQIDRKYVVLRIEPHGDGQTQFSRYNAQFSLDGTALPVTNRGDVLLVYVPFVASDSKIVVQGLFQRAGQERGHDLLELERKPFPVDLTKGIDGSSSGIDYPVYKRVDTIDLRANKAAIIALETAPVAPADAPKAPAVEFPDQGKPNG
jgi:hypothetical protein